MGETILLYHKDIGFPINTKLPTGKFLFFGYSHHAVNASKDDRYGEFTLPRPLIIDFKEVDIFELGISNDAIVKVGCRMPCNELYDISYVVSMTSKSVITLWLNEKGDIHQTLDSSRYQRP